MSEDLLARMVYRCTHRPFCTKRKKYALLGFLLEVAGQ